ncbi:class I SAM-dependent methyltransferase [Desulforhopalus sp. 52FAK]
MISSHSLQTISAYDKNSEKYAEKFDDYEIYQRRITDFQQKYIAQGSHILDLGCGPANNIRTILEQDQTCSFDGIDLSEKFIQIAKQRFPQFTFLQQDISNLNVESQYAVIIASFCIVHLTNEETAKVFKSIGKHLTSDGYLYLSYMNGTRSGFESASFSKEEIFFNYYQDQFIIELLSKNDIEIVEIGKEEYIESDGSITVDSFVYARKIKKREYL